MTLSVTINRGKIIFLKEDDKTIIVDFENKTFVANSTIKLESLVDFTVEVEQSRDIRVLQLTDIQIIDAVAKDGKVEYVICSGKSNIFAIKAKVYIDCTGSGDFYL